LINTAIIPLMVKINGLFPDDITIGEGLEELAKMTPDELIRTGRVPYPLEIK